MLRSSNYAQGSAGWLIRGDGLAEFNNLTVRTQLDIGGDDNTSFHVDNAGNMWSGSGISNFSTAPFRVTNAGVLTATNANITGAITATSGTFTGTINATGGTFSGNITASGTISGGSISGATITGGTVQTATSGRRVLLNTSGIKVYKSNGAEAFSLYGSDQVYADSLVLHNGYPSGPIRLWSTIGDGATIVRALGVTNSSTGSNVFLFDADAGTPYMNFPNHTLSSDTYRFIVNPRNYSNLQIGIGEYYNEAGVYASGSDLSLIGSGAVRFKTGGSNSQWGVISPSGFDIWNGIIVSSTNFDGTWRNEGNGYYKMAQNPWSTRKVKTDIQEVGESLDPSKLLDIPIVQFKYIEGYLAEGDPIYNTDICGLLAEEVFEHYPTVVRLNSETWEPQSINYQLMIPPLLGLVQKLAKRIQVLENMIQ